MVLDVAIGVVGGLEIVFELVKDQIEGFAEDVDEHVEAAPMRHPHDHFFDAVFGSGVEELMERRDDGLDALEGESLLPLISGVEKGLEDLGIHELAEDPSLLLVRHLGLVEHGLHLLLEPTPDLPILDVDVLDADLAAVGFAKILDEFAQRDAFRPAEMTGVVDPIKVILAEAVGLEFENRVLQLARAEGIDIGDEVADIPVGEDEPGNLTLVCGFLRRWHVGACAEIEPREEDLPLLRSMKRGLSSTADRVRPHTPGSRGWTDCRDRSWMMVVPP